MKARKLWQSFKKCRNFAYTRPKLAYGRQGLAGSWGQDTDEMSTFLVFLTSHFAPAALSSDLTNLGPLMTMKIQSVTHGGVQLTSFGAKNVTVTNRGVQLTSFGANNVTVTNRGIQLTSFDAKNVTVTNRGIQLTF